MTPSTSQRSQFYTRNWIWRRSSSQGRRCSHDHLSNSLLFDGMGDHAFWLVQRSGDPPTDDEREYTGLLHKFVTVYLDDICIYI
jgi:hypothetical protein